MSNAIMASDYVIVSIMRERGNLTVCYDTLHASWHRVTNVSVRGICAQKLGYHVYAQILEEVCTSALLRPHLALHEPMFQISVDVK
jgi:hypothetical protein